MTEALHLFHAQAHVVCITSTAKLACSKAAVAATMHGASMLFSGVMALPGRVDVDLAAETKAVLLLCLPLLHNFSSAEAHHTTDTR